MLVVLSCPISLHSSCSWYQYVWFLWVCKGLPHTHTTVLSHWHIRGQQTRSLCHPECCNQSHEWTPGHGKYYFLMFRRFVLFFNIQLFFSSPQQRPMTSDRPDFFPRCYPLHNFLIWILEKEPVFPFSMLSAKQGNYWYRFYNAFGMTRSLTWDWTQDLPHSKPALYH